MILDAVGIGMVVPDFIKAEAWPAYSAFNIVVMVAMYVVFTRLQTIEHRYFFEYAYKGAAAAGAHSTARISGPYHGVMLFLTFAALLFLVP